MRPAPQWKESYIRGELGMKWYHFFKWCMVLCVVIAPIQFLSLYTEQALLLQVSLWDFIALSFTTVPLTSLTAVIVTATDIYFFSNIATKLFQYKYNAYKWCAYYICAAFVEAFFVVFISYTETGAGNTGVAIAVMARILIIFLPTYFYLKKRKIDQLLGYAPPQPIDISVYSPDDTANDYDAPEPGMQFCQYCNRSIPAESVFCTYCGKQIGSKY